jgi:dihydroorotate dehydrogenase
MYKKLVRPLFFAWSERDHEEAHLLFKKIAKAVQSVPPLLSLLSLLYTVNNPRTVCGIEFRNPVGLAAGLDKDAEIPLFAQALGFGFMEIGGVLPRPQVGNPRPRLFRIPKHEALINRMGFNSAGADAVLENFKRHENKITIPVGLSLAKMKDTPLEDTADEYKEVTLKFCERCAYVVVNVSSPNTPNMRKLQDYKYLVSLVRNVVFAEFQAMALGQKSKRPVLVKIAPDLGESDIDEVYRACTEADASGLIIGNTTLSRPAGINPMFSEQGGWSGGDHLFNLVRKKVRHVRRIDAKIPIIACGGINSSDRGKIMLEEEGADLIQIVAGLVYEGPRLVRELASI